MPKLFHLHTRFAKRGTVKPVRYYWFTIKSRNNKTIATSETYKTKRSAINGVRAVLKAVDPTYNPLDITVLNKWIKEV